VDQKSILVILERVYQRINIANFKAYSKLKYEYFVNHTTIIFRIQKV